MPSTHLNLSSELKFTELYSSEQGGPAVETCKIITSQRELSEFFNGSPPGNISFVHQYILAIGLGSRTTSGYRIRVGSVQVATGGIMSGRAFVYWKEVKPDGPVLQVMTNPVLLFGVDASIHVLEVYFMKQG